MRPISDRSFLDFDARVDYDGESPVSPTGLAIEPSARVPALHLSFELPHALNRLRIRCEITLVAIACAATSAQMASCDDQFQTIVRPLLNNHCVDCHGANPDDINGDTNFAAIVTEADIDASFEVWEKAIELIRDGSMPPPDEPPLPPDGRDAFSNWYEQRFVIGVTAQPGDFRTRRLAGYEYRNTLHSLLGYELRTAVIEAEQTVSETSLVIKLLQTDPPGPSRFTNDTSGNPLTTVIWDQYSHLSDCAIEELFSANRRNYLIAYTGELNDGALTPMHAQRMIRKWTRRAFRRDVDEQLLAKSLSAVEAKTGAELTTALQTELKTVLMSPEYIYRGLLHTGTRSDSQSAVFDVDQFELAERLSFFFWADMPDDELIDLAKRRELAEEQTYRDQIDRMLASPKARSLAEDFGVQWFSLNEIDRVSKNPPYSHALRSQPIDFLNYLFTEGRPRNELVDSNVTFVNPHTARFYPRDRKQMVRYKKQKGIEVEIIANQRITLHETPQRGGLLTMPGVLAMNKGAVQRGTWVLERIMGEHLPDPPPDVGQVPPNSGNENLSFRQRFELHRSQATCAVCHDKIDPLGFALEAYDNGGKFVGNPSHIDSSGQLPSGETFDDFSGLRTILVTSQRERVIRTMVERTLAYALCRKLEYYDRPTIDSIVSQLKSNSATFHDLFIAVATSLPFTKTTFRSN